MDDLISRSPNAQALQAEMHRDQLLREAAATRLARTVSPLDAPLASAPGTGLIIRIRSALGSVGRTSQPECPECA